MNIFIDTNVILENFLQREEFEVAHHLFEALKKQKATLYMSSGSFYTMVFLVDKYLKRECKMAGEERLLALRQIMSCILLILRTTLWIKNQVLWCFHRKNILILIRN